LFTNTTTQPAAARIEPSPSSARDALAKPLAGRLVFAHQLRGIAALLVVITHLFGTYFGEQALVSTLTLSPDLHLTAANWVYHFHIPYLNGPFGVALFFLISGFVIPFSLAKQSPLQFLIARFFRIIPTYALALGIGMLALSLSAHYWGVPFPHRRLTMLSNALLLNQFIGIGSIDPVNWTLSIEVKFYFLMAIFGLCLLRRSLVPTLLCAGAALFVALLWANLHGRLTLVALESSYLIFMLIGVGFYQHFEGILSWPALAARSVLLFALFAASWSIGPLKEQFPAITWFYADAAIVFAAAYRLRHWFRPVKVLDFLGDISYPLYVTHWLIGFTMLKLLMGRGMAFGPAVSVVLVAVTVLSWLLHRLVELPTQRLGKRLAARWTARR
jgi:peptidoglycan/LPS O-acetylase OafA/YrhL